MLAKWNIATQEWKICDMDIEIVKFVINGSMKMAIPPDLKEEIQVNSRSVALCRVFDLKFNRILVHLAQIILKFFVVTDKTPSMYLNVKLNEMPTDSFPLRAQTINSASYVGWKGASNYLVNINKKD